MKQLGYKSLDSVLHSRIRLAIVSVLIGVEEIEFTSLRDIVGATDGNMNTHLKKLEAKGYMCVKKLFIERKPTTMYWLSAKGCESFKKYVEALEKFIK